MTIEPALRGVAGVLVLISLALGQLHSPYWLVLTAVVGLNLFQSMFTDWCPMKSLLRACGLKTAAEQAFERVGFASQMARERRA